MPRRYLRRILPTPRRIREEGAFRIFGSLINNTNLWHLNRHSVAMAVAVGLFCCFVPIPAQMLLAAAFAIMLGCNLPISIVIVWISNPLTVAPLFFAAYKVGAWILDQPMQDDLAFEVSLTWLTNQLSTIWQPFLLGCFTMGVTLALIGYVIVQIIWRIHVAQSWKQRRLSRMQKSKNKSQSPTSALLAAKQPRK